MRVHDPMLVACEWLKVEADERDPDGCAACQWETWRCHEAMTDALMKRYEAIRRLSEDA
jgi:hypothetical protein